MVEGEGCSRPTGDPRDDETAGTRARGPVRGLPEPAGDLPALLAALGQYLEGHAPEDVVILLREELARREFQAYVNGWRDAADQYEPVLEEARRIAQTRRLRLVGRTPGQAAVIPFPQGDGVAGTDEPGTEAAERPARRGSTRPVPPGASGGGEPRDRPGPAEPPAAPGTRGGAAPPDRRPVDVPEPRRSQEEPPQDRQAGQGHRPTGAPRGGEGTPHGQAAPHGQRHQSAGAPHRQDQTRQDPPHQDQTRRGPKHQDQAREARQDQGHQGPKRQDSEEQPPAGAVKPGLVAKSPHSRVPTIPRLPARRRRPGDQSG
ncbi:hypothetical protein AB0J57_24400 [Streptomyces sp. NPDC049837]|uniref:hypothetical protein n=1 Tax=Streptomyces sp. NPDC049837 TaxID=3155277 RepID=UPI003441D215